LSMGPALMAAIVGLLWLNIICCLWEQRSCVYLALFVFVIAIYILWESYNGTVVLAKTRRGIISAVQQREAQGKTNELKVQSQPPPDRK